MINYRHNWSRVEMRVSRKATLQQWITCHWYFSATRFYSSTFASFASTSLSSLFEVPLHSVTLTMPVTTTLTQTHTRTFCRVATWCTCSTSTTAHWLTGDPKCKDTDEWGWGWRMGDGEEWGVRTENEELRSKEWAVERGKECFRVERESSLIFIFITHKSLRIAYAGTFTLPLALSKGEEGTSFRPQWDTSFILRSLIRERKELFLLLTWVASIFQCIRFFFKRSKLRPF